MNRLLILDSNSIINRAFYGIRPLNAPDGTPTNAIYGFINILFKLISDYNPDCILAAFDLKAPTFRHKMYSEYKANRKGMPDDLAAQLPIMKDILSYMNIPILEKEGYEADDIIGTVSRICKEQSAKCMIATGDRDDLQLAGGGTTVILASTKMGNSVTELFDEKAVIDKYGVKPTEFVDMKALMGDSSDNIPGVKGIGEKTASKLIMQFGSIENMYENLDDADVTDKIKQKLSEEKDIAFLSKSLAQIDEYVPIELDFKNIIFDNDSKSFSPELYSLLLNLGLKSTIKKMNLSKPETAVQIDSDFFNSKELISVSDADEFNRNISSLGRTISVFIDTRNNTVNSAAFSDGKTVYYSSAKLYGDTLINAISPILCDESIKKVVFNIKDTMVDLNDKADINGIVFDSALAAYLLNPSKTNDLAFAASEYLGVYIDEQENKQLSLLSDDDVSDSHAKYALVIYALYEKLSKLIDENNQNELYYDVELPLIKVLCDMQIAGFKIDSAELKKFGEFLTENIRDFEKKIYELAGEEFNINSPKQLGEILFGKLGLKGGKKTKTGYSTKADILEKLAPDNEIVRLVLEYRSYQKLKSTYCDGFSLLVNPATQRIHSVFHQTGTVTGRLSSSEPNMQNIPTRTKLGRELRKMFIADDGCILIDADYSQIELRVLAHLANDETMIEAFKNGEDIHSVTASKILGIPIDKLTKEQRSSAKTINFGIVYGMSEYTLSQDLHISFKEAKEYMNEYFNKYSGIRNYLDMLKESARQNGYVKTLMNRIRYIPEISSSQAMVRSFGERAAMNTPVQGTAADIMKKAMVRVYNKLKSEGLKAKIILQVHDELIIESPLDEAEKVKSILKYEMENAIKLNVPLAVDMQSGKSWYDAK
ncbi:MAG: DNA polymerase I [Clostridia bacterium]|nr:DNA polymerase I [Clostridia bacterium]